MIDGTVRFESYISPWDMPEAWQPNLANLIRHVQKFGMDNSRTGWKGAAETYQSYTTLAGDAAVMTGRAYLGVDAYVVFIEAIGYGHFAPEARAHWAAVRKETQ